MVLELYEVSKDISPGTYVGRAGTGALDSCSWTRLSGASGEFSDVIAVDNARGQFYVEILDTDKYFRTGCVVTPLEAWPTPDEPLSEIEVGMYIVGQDISPGTYVGRAGTGALDSCSWTRLSGASGEFSDVIAVDNARGQFYVEILDTDKYFRTGCALDLTTTRGSESWRGLVVAPEDRCSPYDSDDYRYSQSVEQRIVTSMGGIVYGPYTGRWFDNTSETDIEHIVARSEAHDSGLCDASAETRRRFATDLLNLTLASPEVNRSQKSGKDASEWLPELNRCWFASRVVEVRREYALSVDEHERDILEGILSGCTSTEMVVLDAPEGTSETLTPAPEDEEGSSALELYDDNGNGRITCAEARNHGIAPVRRGHPAYEYMNDADDDGVVCEGTSETLTPAPEDEEGSSALELYDDNGNGRITCAEARNHGIAPVRRGHPAYEYMNDAADDGVVCEGTSETLTPAPEDEEGSSALELYDDNGNGRITCAEARNHGIAPVRRGHPAYEYMNDADDDGVVCE